MPTLDFHALLKKTETKAAEIHAKMPVRESAYVNDQRPYSTKSDTDINKPGTVSQSVPNKSGTVSQSVPNKSGTVSQSVPNKPGTVSQSVPNKPGTVSQSVPNKPGTVSQSVPNKPGTVSQSVPNKPGTVSQSVPNKPGTVSQSVPNKPGTVSQSVPNKPGTVSQSVPNKPGTVSQSVPNKPGTVSQSVPNKPGTVSQSVPNKPGTVSQTVPNKPGTVFTHESGTVLRRPPHGSKASEIFAYILQEEVSSRCGQTPPISRSKIALDTKNTTNTVKKSIERLIAGGCIVRIRANAGLNGATIYSTTAIGRMRYENNKPGTVFIHESGTVSTSDIQSISQLSNNVSSSSYKTTTTNQDLELEQKLKNLCEATGLAAHRVGPNDLLPLLPSFGDESALLRSVEHIAFYLSTPDASSVKQPKGFVISTLRKGYYAKPSGFVSLEEKQHQAEMADKQQRLEQARARASAAFETDFELWRLENDMNNHRNKLNGLNPSSLAGKAILRQIFAEETGREIPSEASKVA